MVYPGHMSYGSPPRHKSGASCKEARELEKNVGKSCSTCGQVFDPSISFCPTDGTKLSAELVTASSHELIQVTSRNSQKKSDSPRVSSPQIVLDKPTTPTPSSAASASPTSPASQSITPAAAPTTSPAPSLKSDDTPNESFGNGSRGATSEPQDRNVESSAKKNIDSNYRNRFDSGSVEDTGDNLRDTRQHLVPTLIGATLDNQYEIVSVVGKGGMSFVYKATHLLMRKTVAIKTLLPHLTLQATSLQRFQQEAQAASNLKHPNIIAVHNFGTTPDGEPYLVMDYVEGSSISDDLEKYGFVAVDRAVDIFIQVADALAHAHQRGIIHRDLKPSNILLLEKDGRKDHVNIVDFGIAKMLPQDGVEAVSLTQTGEVFGSPLYMSPEQCKGERLDARSDIYSMGCLMYETLTGRPATSGDNTMEVLYNHIHEVPAPMKAPLTHVPPQLEKIVFKTLAKDPAQRYQTMGELRDELEAFSKHRKTSILNRVTDYWQLFFLRRKPRTKRDKIIVAIAVSGFLCATFFAFQLASLYWAAADSPASKTAIVWDEDREMQRVNKEPVETDKARLDVMMHTRAAASMDDSHTDPTDLVNYLSGPAEYLMNRHLWKSALEMYELAYKYSLKYNDYLVLRTMTLRLAMAECLVNLHQYEEAARIVDEMKRRLHKGYERDFVDHSILASKLGYIYYLQGKWQPALQEMDQAYKTWTEKHTQVLPFTFYNLPGNPETSYDFTLLISRMATSYQRIYQESVVNGTPDRQALQSAVRLYKMAGNHWNHIVGGRDSNRNVSVAMANYVYLDHILDKNADLDKEYAEVAKRGRDFGVDSAYEAVILLNYSGYLMDKGRYFDAAANRIHAWRIFAQQAKSDSSGTTIENQNLPGSPPPSSENKISPSSETGL